MPKRVGVLLSGCGVYDGSEIHEAVLTLLALDRAGCEWVALAPDIDQADVVNHATGNPSPGERRSVLAEAARIARGEILALGKADPKSLDAVAMPGGFGAAKNLSTFAADGANCRIEPSVEKFLKAAHEAGKPIGAWCIAPAVLARLSKSLGIRPTLTIGTDAGTARALAAMGAVHENQPPTGVSVDRENRFVTTPCYMTAGRIGEVADGINAAVQALLALSDE